MDAKQKPRYVRGLLWFVDAAVKAHRQILAFDDFYPVVVRVFDEGDVAHRAVFRAFLVGDVILVKPADGCVEIRHADADVAEAARFAVAVVVVEGGVGFAAPVVGQLQDAALPGNPGAARFFVFRDVFVAAQYGEEVEAEFAAFVVAFAQERHAEDAGVEVQ